MKKFEYMQVNITHSNMVKYCNQYGELGWIIVHMQVHKPNSPVLDNTVFTVTFARVKEEASMDQTPDPYLQTR